MRSSTVRVEQVSQHAAGPVREVMDIRQAAEYLGISADSLYRYASEGTLPGFRLGNRWRFKKSRLDIWMDEQSEASVPRKTRAARKPVRSTRQG